jgi:EAL domain-containing protein (putative c-di-GMP-specific phosphodiesterase class I)
MPVLLVLALALGYAVGALAAVFLLPQPVVEPVLSRLMIASGVLGLGAALFFGLKRHRRATADSAAVAESEAALSMAAEHPLPDDDLAEVDDIIGDPEVLEVLGRRLADPLSRMADGSIGPKELRQILYDGRVELNGTPVLALPDRTEAFLLIKPILRDNAGADVGPHHYLRTVARCGLGPLLDRVVIVRTLQTLIRGGSDGKDQSGGVIGCAIGAENLASPLLLDGVEEFLRDHPGAGSRLVLEVDRLPRQPQTVPAMRRLTRHGIRFCLKRLSTAPLELDRMRDLGFAFVHLAAPRFATVPEVANTLPQLAALVDTVRDADLTLVVDRSGRPSADEGDREPEEDLAFAPLPSEARENAA